MAESDNRPRVNAEDIQGYSSSFTGYLPKQNFGKLISYIYDIVYQSYLPFFLNYLNKKLDEFEKKSQVENLQNITKVTSLLREWFKIKKTFKKHNIKNVQPDLYSRAESLKKILLKNSLQNMIDLNTEPHKVNYRNSYQQFSSLMKPTNTARSQITYNIPTRLHWRSAEAQNEINFVPKPSIMSRIYLHTSFHHLSNILSTKVINNLFDNDKVKICDAAFETNDAELVCGISLKLTPEILPEKGKNPSFWQQLQAHTVPRMLSHLQDMNLSEHIGELFFKTPSHYADFMNLLQNNKQFDLLSLVRSLDEKQQIVIHQNSSELRMM
ncbi:MAG: hypothetical protein H0U71_06360 [Gammaproteobacteria bacterium]|nr:hypothetical protein [Gammaproteobacteria bacterium]